jgi:ATP-dependent DNA helicase RecG
MDTGTGDVIRDCLTAGLGEPVFKQEDVFKTILWRKVTPQVTTQVTPQVTHQVTPQVETQTGSETPDNIDLASRLLWVMNGEMSRQKMLELLGLRDPKNFRERYLNPALQHKWIEMTNTNATGSNQSYRLTRKGKIRRTKLKKI